MFRPLEIGKISLEGKDHQQERKAVWVIENIFSYTEEDKSYVSPHFFVRNTQWYLKIYPNGKNTNISLGWISLYLMKVKDSTPPQTATYGFSIKTAKDSVRKIRRQLNWVFDNDSTGRGFPRFLESSELLKRRSELAPSDILTVVCTMRISNASDFRFSLSDKLSENLTDLFTSKKHCDATLRVQNEHFSVHRCVLAARSPVFDAMFEFDMLEKKTGIVDIPDCSPQAFRDFLKYVYSGVLENHSCGVQDLYRIADKYCVDELKSACVLSLMVSLSVDNVCDVTLFAHQAREVELKSKAQSFFVENFAEVFSTAKWIELMKDNSRLANELLENMASKKKK